jgi:hypothetical protein
MPPARGGAGAPCPSNIFADVDRLPIRVVYGTRPGGGIRCEILARTRGGGPIADVFLDLTEEEYDGLPLA